MCGGLVLAKDVGIDMGGHNVGMHVGMAAGIDVGREVCIDMSGRDVGCGG